MIKLNFRKQEKKEHNFDDFDQLDKILDRMARTQKDERQAYVRQPRIRPIIADERERDFKQLDQALDRMAKTQKDDKQAFVRPPKSVKRTNSKKSFDYDEFHCIIDYINSGKSLSVSTMESLVLDDDTPTSTPHQSFVKERPVQIVDFDSDSD